MHSIMNKHAHWSNVVWAASLVWAELAFIPWHFKVDDSSSPRGNVEGWYVRVCLHPDCF